MPRRTLVRSKIFPYHVTARANNREPFVCGTSQAWKVLTHQCFEASVLFRAKVHAFVVMNNHFHLIVSTPEEDLGIVMKHFMESGTRRLNSISGREGHAFSGRYRWSIIQDVAYARVALKYVYRNPVRAGICENVESYPYSTLSSVLGETPFPCPLYPLVGAQIPDATHEGFLNWLNQPFGTEGETAIRKAMQTTQFKPAAASWQAILEQMKALPQRCDLLNK